MNLKWGKAKRIKATTVYVSERISEREVSIFFKRILREFKNELQLLADQWYNYEPGIDGESGTEDVFALIERSYVGLFNSAVIRCFPKDATLQEFSVQEGRKSYVRGDYLVKHLRKGKPINFLFEAKQRVFDGRKYESEELIKYFDPFISQCKKYYEAEKNFYVGDTYLVPLVFERVRYSEHCKMVMELDDNNDDGVTDFYCFIHTDVAGLMVYGKIVSCSC